MCIVVAGRMEKGGGLVRCQCFQFSSVSPSSRPLSLKVIIVLIPSISVSQFLSPSVILRLSSYPSLFLPIPESFMSCAYSVPSFFCPALLSRRPAFSSITLHPHHFGENDSKKISGSGGGFSRFFGNFVVKYRERCSESVDGGLLRVSFSES